MVNNVMCRVGKSLVVWSFLALISMGSNAAEFTKPKVAVIGMDKKLQYVLQSAGITYDLCGCDGNLGNYKIVFVPSCKGNPGSGERGNVVGKPDEIHALELFVKNGGKLIVFLNEPVPAALTDLLKVSQINLVKPKKPEFNELRLCEDAASVVPGLNMLPKDIYLDHHAEGPKNSPLTIVAPRAGCRIIANWRDPVDTNSHPAILVSDNGSVITKPSNFRDDEDSVMLIMSLIAHHAPEMWREAMDNVLAAGAGDFSYHHSLDEVGNLIAARRSQGMAVKEMEGLLDAARELAKQARDQKNAITAYSAARKSKQAAEDAYCALFASKRGEGRGVYLAGNGVEAPENTMQLLSDDGFNMLSTMGSYSYGFHALALGLTDKVPQEPSALLSQGKKHGIQIDLFAPFYRLGDMAPMVDMGGGAAGHVCAVCPTLESNRKIMQTALLAQGLRWDLSGMTWDEFGYAQNCCYCEYCRKQFEQDRALKTEEWPEDVLIGGHHAAYQRWRAERWTSLLKAITTGIKKVKPWLQVGFCARPDFPAGPGSSGEDVGKYISEGIVDYVEPMDYTSDIKRFEQTVKSQVESVDGAIPIYILPCIRDGGEEAFSSVVKLVDMLAITRRLGADGFGIYMYEDYAFKTKFAPALHRGITKEPTVPPHLHPDIVFAFEGIKPGARVLYGIGEPIRADIGMTTQSVYRKPVKMAQANVILETIDGTDVAALGGVKADAGNPGNVRVVLPPQAEGVYRLAVNGSALFDDGTTCGFVSRSRFIHVVPLIKVKPVLRDATTLSVLLENQADKESQGKFRLELSSGTKPSPSELPYKLQGKGTGAIEFKLPESPMPLTGNLICVHDGGEIKTAISVDACQCNRITPVIDGNLDEWQALKPTILDKESQVHGQGWKGPDDLSAEAWLGWDQNNFYFAARVKDNLHFNTKTGAAIWDGDAVQFGFDMRGNAQDNGGYDRSDDYECCLALTQSGMQFFRWVAPEGKRTGGLKEARAAVTRTDGGTNYELAIPWAELAPFRPQTGSVFKMSFAVIDDDSGNGYKNYIELTPGIVGGKNPSCFKNIILKK